MGGFEDIRWALAGGVARLSLARPPLNILTIAMMREVAAALEAGAREPGLKALVVAAEGKAFSAGAAVEEHTADLVAEMLEAFHAMIRRLRNFPALTVAAVQGAALGGGCELATACDLVVAAEGARLGQPEVALGVFPPAAAALFPALIGRGRALELLLTGEAVTAAEAARLGLIARAVPAEALEREVAALVARVQDKSAAVLRLAKRAVLQGLGQPFEAALERAEAIYLKELMATADAAEGLRAFLEKRQPAWKDR
jgi:cyclohexa-1,5-dienecarbonyl-CoA hydratase